MEKNVIECRRGGVFSSGQHGEAAKSIHGEQGYARGDPQRFEIAANQGDGWGVIFDEDDFGGAAAEGFDADGAGSGEEIDEAGAGNVGGQHVEERFAEAVAGGAQGEAFEALEDTASVGSGDDAHEYSYR